ncbi:MAG TPA: hypothetical protein VJ453_11740 [Terriglobales bacterium]|nr:hypothetical protein [Terriglobales bacterium]
MRKGGKYIKEPGRIWFVHLGSELTLEDLPRPLVLELLREAHQFLAGGQVRQPDIVEISARKFPFRHAAGRSAHGSNPQAFIYSPRRS